MLVGCGDGGPPRVDPRPIGDGGLSERTTLEGGSPGGAGGDGGNGGHAGSSGQGGGAMADAGADGAAGGDAAIVVPTTVLIDMTEPAEGELVQARGRFAPKVSFSIETDSTAPDQAKTVVAELWSTGANAAKISTTSLALIGTVEQTTSNGDPTDSDAGAPVDAAPDTPGRALRTVFTFGDTPIDLSSRTTGEYELRVAAATVGGRSAMAQRMFRVDAGPLIRVLSPKFDQSVRGSVFVSVEVTDPYHAGAPRVAATVAGLPVSALARTGDRYEATVPDTIGNPPLAGTQLLEIRATSEAGIEAAPVVVRFTFDNRGPTITNTKPSTGTLIGGIVKLEAEVTDPAGVDTKTVVAVVAHGGTELEVPLDQDPNDPKHFSHLFDTRRLSSSVLYPTLSFRASDVPGNQSAVGHPVAVDNTPPLSDLDPPRDLRIRRYLNGNWRCSWELDPLGNDAVSEGDVVRQLFDVRARVEDQGNSPAAGSVDITPLARLDTGRVELLVLQDTERALIVDSDGDGVCDAVNPKLVPTTTPMTGSEALLVNLAPVPPTGAANFTPDPSAPDGTFPDCTIGSDTLLPPTLCRTTDLSIAIPARLSDEGAVWTIPRVVAGTAQCVGNQLDSLGNHIADGPTCLAIRAADQLGNSQVSRILHVCIDHDGDGAECQTSPAQITGGTTVTVDTAVPHNLADGARVMLGGARQLFEANGVWKITVDGPQRFHLQGARTPVGSDTAAFMPWTSRSDCTGRQTSLEPVIVDDTTSCRPWRGYARGEHLDVP